jgi:hypothetical protein
MATYSIYECGPWNPARPDHLGYLYRDYYGSDTSRFLAACFYEPFSFVWPEYHGPRATMIPMGFSWVADDPRNDENNRIYLWDGTYLMVKKVG